MGTSATAADSGRRTRVLLVEDEFLLRDLMAEVLAAHGFEVHTANNGQDALAHLNCGSPCDILLTDLDLGNGIDGAALAELARKLRPGLPVVYVSGSASRLHELQAVEGATVVAKPYIPERLCALLGGIGDMASLPTGMHSAC